MWRQLSDDAGRTVAFPAPPRRIVSLVPSLTELVAALGAADRLVAVTAYCTDPPDVVAGLPKVGGTKNPDVARIRDLQPDLVLVNTEENRREDFQALADLGLPLFVSFPRDLEETAASIERVGRALDAIPAAEAMAATIRTCGVPGAHPRRRVFCPIWRKPWMSFNRDTYAHDLLWRSGADNVCADRSERYPVVDLASIAAADPEIVLLPSEPYPFCERHRLLLGDLAGTAALRNHRVHLLDGRALFWYGARTAPAVRQLHALLTGPPPPP